IATALAPASTRQLPQATAATRRPRPSPSTAAMVNTRASSSRADSVGPESSPSRSKRSSATPRRGDAPPSGWSHAPTQATLLWMAVSLPLVAWDTVYVLGRPHTMEGGALHWPLWVPYQLYGEVDHVYGWKAYNARNGFTGAQGLLNLVETLMYLAYLWLCFTRRTPTGAAGARAVGGRAGAAAVLIGFSAAVMTLSKTVLYWLNEYYSGFDNIGHNPFLDLIYLWIIPNGSWLVGSAYMTWSLGGEILDGLETASAHAKRE
ncbi:Uncharacterized protein TCAP_04431, partial [Tolypocladium capitatum]